MGRRNGDLDSAAVGDIIARSDLPLGGVARFFKESIKVSRRS